MTPQTQFYDLIITGGRVVDPEGNLDGQFDIGVSGDRIAAVAAKLPTYNASRVVNASGKIVCAGLIDMHVHVFEWATGFGLNPDDAGVQAGVTTGVDVGSSATWSFPAFKHYIIDQAETEIVTFPSITLLGPMTANRGGPNIFTEEFIDIDALGAMRDRFPDLILGIKTYAESGSYSHWDNRFFAKSVEAGHKLDLPLYIHTGELLAVDESHRPDPTVILPEVLEMAKPGDLLGHCYSNREDGILGNRNEPIPEIAQAVKRGIGLDVGHGINFSFDTAKRMLDAGLEPYTISSDVHCDLVGEHNESTLDYSLVGTMSKLLALGVDLNTIIAGVTCNPAKVLKKQDEIGSLAPGSRADITILDDVREPWEFRVRSGEKLTAERRLIPAYVVREGRVIVPSGRLLRDVLPIQDEAA